MTDDTRDEQVEFLEGKLSGMRYETSYGASPSSTPSTHGEVALAENERIRVYLAGAEAALVQAGWVAPAATAPREPAKLVWLGSICGHREPCCWMSVTIPETSTAMTRSADRPLSFRLMAPRPLPRLVMPVSAGATSSGVTPMPSGSWVNGRTASATQWPARTSFRSSHETWADVTTSPEMPRPPPCLRRMRTTRLRRRVETR